MASPYKRRRPSLVRNLWIYRKLIVLAMVLGLMLWFIWANNSAVTVEFPFGLGHLSSTVGLVALLSALAGAVVTALAMAVGVTFRRIQASRNDGDEPAASLDDDRPPPDYAAKTPDGLSDPKWS
ncbi:MAG: DUF1049 domain-containing protein [Isosphaeraceae bacterium]|nr:DUF1049 domain-containing protein [Isosphaeraceae bacterium]